MPIPLEREIYRRSGRINAGRFTILYVLTLVLAVLAGGLLCVAWHTGTFFTGISPLFAGLAVAGAMYGSIHLGHCRNALVGTVAGAVAGLVAILSAYQFDLAYTQGWANLVRLGLLPGYIDFRIHNDGVLLIGGEFQANPPSKNRFMLLLNAAGAIVLPLGAGWKHARRPFCETHRAWMATFTVALTVNSADAVLEALREGDAAALQAAIAGIEPDATEYVKADVLYVPRAADSTAYLTLTWMSLYRETRELADDRILASRWRLDPTEAAVVADAFRISDAGFARPDRVRLNGETPPLDDAGTVVDLGPNQVFDERARVIVGAMIHVPIGICIVLGLGSFFGGVAGHYVAAAWPIWANIATLGGGFGFLLLGVAVACYVNVLPARYLFARLRSAIDKRPDAIVRPGDPGAVFVEVVPRRNWVPMNGENADDFGLLRYDEERGLLLFEGGAERWAIPTSALIGCEVIEYCCHPETGEPANIPVLVLTANVHGVAWERPLCPRSLECRRQTVATRRLDMSGLQGW